MTEPQSRLARALGHGFSDPALLQRALTHRSAGSENYERLEFLGDALISLVIAEAVFQRLPQADEGDLSRLRASLVCEESLAGIAERLPLSEALILGPGELKSGGFRRQSILADSLEALLGAIYLDGGFSAARECCERLFAAALDDLPDPARLKDAKTRLQERLQATGRPLPEYQLVGADGPQHRQVFRVDCRLGDATLRTTGHGSSRKVAEQDAAERMLQQVIQAEEQGDA